MGEKKSVWLFIRIISSIAGALAGAFITVIAVDYTNVSIFGDKSNVFLPALIGVPVGSSVGYTLSYWKGWKILTKISMVIASSVVGFLFSFGFIYFGLRISEKYVMTLFILQFLFVIAITGIIGTLMNKSSLKNHRPYEN